MNGPAPATLTSPNQGSSYPGSPYPGPSHPRSSYIGPSHPGPSHPGSPHPGSSHPGTSHPASSYPGSSQKVVFHPGTSHQGSSNPGSSHPGPSHPGSSYPGSSHPGPSHPGSSYPGSSQQVSFHPGTSHQGLSHPGPSHPGSLYPGSSQQVSSHPGSSHPGPSHPGASYPGSSQQVSSHPGSSNPGPSQLGSSHPGLSNRASPHPGSHHGPSHPGSPQPFSSLEDKLRLAASKGEADKVQELLQAGATFHPDKDGRTALQYAALNGHAEVCKLLLQQKPDLDAQDALGYTAFHRAASQGHLEVIEILAEAGCAVNKQDKNGNTALHEAAWNGYSKTIEMMVKHDADTFVSNKGGFTALHLASQNGHNESSRVLLYAGCNADLKNNYGDTALHTAARYGHAGVTRILLSARCRINEQNKNGDTALHIASALKRRKIAKLLVEAAVDVQVTNKQNETAMDVAKRKEHPEIIIIIQSFSRPKTPKSPRPPSRAHQNVTFKDEIEVDGPIVVANENQPIKQEKQEKERRFFFFKKKKKDKDKDKTPPAKVPSNGEIPPPGHQCVPGEPWRPVQGFFSQYVPKTGVQYYRDLAGNIKQGPVGYSPLCQCGPSMKNLEQKIETTRENMVEHVNASHQLLKGQIDHLDKRTAQQVYSIDRLTKERMENEHNLCNNRISERLRHERHESQKMFTQYNEQIQSWLDSKLASYGHCLSHHHDDTALPSQKFFTDFHENENGRLFRSRSDETLSVSDYSGKHRKKDFYESRQEAMQLIRAWQLPSYRQSSRKRDRQINNNVAVTKAEVHGKMDRVADGASPKYEGSPNRQMMGQHPSMNKHAPIDVSAIKRETGNQGAIPKRLPHSHSWQHPGSQLRVEGSRSREPSPQVHGFSRSREGSPLDVRHSLRPIVRSQTDSGNLHNSASTPKQNLPERGPPNTRSKPGAPEVPPKPPKPGTGQMTPSGPYNRQTSVVQPGGVVFSPNSGHQGSGGAPSYNQRNSQSYMYVEDSPAAKYKPRMRSTDSLLAEENNVFGQRVTRSKSVDRTLDEIDRDGGGGGSAGNGMDRNMNPGPAGNYPTHRQSGFQQVVPSNSKHGVPYRIPQSGTSHNTGQPNHHVGQTNGHPGQPSPYAGQMNNYPGQINSQSGQTNNHPGQQNHHPGQPNQLSNKLSQHPRNLNQNSARNSISGYRESPYASVSQMQKVATSVHASSPSPRPGFQAYDMRDQNRDSGRESNYADISQFNKDRPPYRSMYGIHGDKGNYSNYESVSMRNSISKSENNLTKDTESADVKPRPNKPPPYGYRYGESGAKSAGNQGNSANNNNNNNSITNYNLSGSYSNQHVNSPNNNAPMRTGSVTPVSGHYGSSNISDNHVVNNHNNQMSNHGNTSQDGFNVSQPECLHHESPYQRTSVYNPAYNQNNKEDSTCSSNQDSGYSSKAKLPYMGQSPDGLPSNSGTPSSSFSMDRSISTGTPSQTNSPFVPHSQNSSPFTPVIGTNSPFSPPKESTPAFSYSPNYDQQTTHQPVNIQTHVNGWYQKKLLEAAEKLRKSEQYGGAHNFSTAPINYDPVNGSDV